MLEHDKYLLLLPFIVTHVYRISEVDRAYSMYGGTSSCMDRDNL
jgi:hypothetical protein